MSLESVIPSKHLILCCSLLLLPSVYTSIRVFSIESALHIRWPKYWSFSFSMSPCNEYSGLISFRIDWLYLLAVQEIFFNTLLRADVNSPSSHPTTSSSEIPFSCLQSFPASGSFLMSQLFTSCLSNEYSGRISFRIDWFDLLAVQGTLKSLLQHHSSKPSVLWCSAFFMVQLSHPYMITGKTIALTR